MQKSQKNKYCFFSNFKRNLRLFFLHLVINTIRCAGILYLLFFEEKKIWFEISCGLIAISWVCLIVIILKKPEVIQKIDTDLLGLYRNYRSGSICIYCEIKKNEGSRHCHICKACVKVSFI